MKAQAMLELHGIIDWSGNTDFFGNKVWAPKA